jgi:hypothetical protein
MDYLFRIYYLDKRPEIVRNIKEKFKTIVSVNYESEVRTDKKGKWLLEETERRGFIKIRDLKKYEYKSKIWTMDEKKS